MHYPPSSAGTSHVDVIIFRHVQYSLPTNNGADVRKFQAGCAYVSWHPLSIQILYNVRNCAK